MRLKNSFHHRKDLDILLAQVPAPQAPLKDRVQWFFDLIDWIRLEGSAKTDIDFNTGAPQAARTRYLLILLDRNPDWKKNVARALRSIVLDTHAVELFIQTGLSSKDHFSGEFMARLNEKILPQVPKDQELHYIFRENFKSARDIEWVQLLDSKTLPRIYELFEFEKGADEPQDWNSFKHDAEKAILILALQVQGLGLSHEIRERLSSLDFEKTPFYLLPKVVEKFLNEKDPDLRRALENKVRVSIEDTKRSLLEIHEHLNEQGVSVQIVYKIDRLERLLKRISDLLSLVSNERIDPYLASQILGSLIAENVESRSVLKLINQNFSLLSRKIVERAGETGEAYITRNVGEYISMFKSAIGGGVVTALTTMIKFSVYALKLSSLYSGFFAAVNYATSFLFMHFMHYTLGTKQSSLTAPALAAKMGGSEEELVDEILNLIRSQFVAILGNVLGVVPMVAAVGWVISAATGATLLSAETALHTLHDFSILGVTPLYAAWTGVLLWVSSLFSGWIENWFVFHRISPALAVNRRMNFIFGATYSRWIAAFLRKNILGIAASVSLGFLLGMTPALFKFFGISLEVRHVTLSSGSIAAALMSLPANMIHSSDVIQAVLGVVSMGILNVGVSFALALQVAIKARKVNAPERKQIYKALLRRVMQRPKSLFWPQETKGGA
jgi:site-specific recombinase